jgi:AraC-like DNA-binding protein
MFTMSSAISPSANKRHGNDRLVDVLTDIASVDSLTVSSFSGVFRDRQISRASPHSCLTMLIELGAGSTVVAGVHNRFAVVGLQNGPTTFEQLGSIDCLEVRLAPSVALRLGFGLSELQSKTVPAESLFGKTAISLVDRLAETDRTKRSVVVRDTFRSLLSGTRKSRTVEAIEHLERAIPGTRIGGLASEFGGSRSAFWRNTRSALGLSAQHYLMLRRFEHALALLEAGIPIAQVAALAGYADQSHLHREVLRFTGVTPAMVVSSNDATSIQDAHTINEGCLFDACL